LVAPVEFIVQHMIGIPRLCTRSRRPSRETARSGLGTTLATSRPRLSPRPADLFPLLADTPHAGPSSPAHAIVMCNIALPIGVVVSMHGSWRMRGPQGPGPSVGVTSRRDPAHVEQHAQLFADVDRAQRPARPAHSSRPSAAFARRIRRRT
jgi:hypothetical protein